ncbi:hypothetical protein [Azospirillum doebereinerae]
MGGTGRTGEALGSADARTVAQAAAQTISQTGTATRYADAAVGRARCRHPLVRRCGRPPFPKEIPHPSQSPRLSAFPEPAPSNACSGVGNRSCVYPM